MADSVQIHADRDSVKHLGAWTTARNFDVRGRSATIELDLRSPTLIQAGDIDITVDLERSVLKLLVPEDAVIDQSELRWKGRGRVKDVAAPRAAGGRTIRLAGDIHGGEVRVHRGGMAILSAMFSREYIEDVKKAHREGTSPTVDDPTRLPRSET